MIKQDVKGKVHSFQSLGTVDGPGVRVVVFLQGCNLRCGCCHNPDTWAVDKSQLFSSRDIVKKVGRFKEYFGKEGGITISGGEPLLQPEFVKSVFSLCHDEGINTCLDTSGSIITEQALSVLDECDRVLLDIKYTTDIDYRKFVGCGIDAPLEFLARLNAKRIPTTIRQVIIPTLNDTRENIERLNELIEGVSCVDKVELLPFRKICQVKYDNLKKEFPFKDLPEPNNKTIKELESYIKKYNNCVHNKIMHNI